MANKSELLYPPQMLIGLAAGLESEYDVAARYGISSTQLDRLHKDAGFKASLAKSREAIDKNGLDADVLSHAVLQELTSRVTRDLFGKYQLSTTPLDLKVKIANVLYTRENQLSQRVRPNRDTGQSGGGFVINITLPSAGGAQTMQINAPLPNYPTAERVDDLAYMGDFDD